MQSHSSNKSRRRIKSIPPYDPASGIIRPYHIRHAVGFSYTTAWRMMRDGRFPASIQLSTGTIGWRRSDIETWLAGR